MKSLILVLCVFSIVLLSNTAICGSMDMDVEGRDSNIAEDTYDAETDVSEPSLNDVETEDAYYNDENDELALKVRNTADKQELDEIYRDENPDVDADISLSDEEGMEVDSDELEEDLSDEGISDEVDDEVESEEEE
ncbi:MAG: hypothetical protein HN337_03540 [Deltaproteobacteria bacterium]|jgi:hypothetical protein|nr:hypothetical protein [Deltaproteobacteria bacterium]